MHVTQPVARGGEIEIGRQLPTPQDHVVEARLPQRRPPAHGRCALGEPQRGHARRGSLDPPEHLTVQGIEVAHVVVDLVEPVLAGHPARADPALRGALGQIEA